MLKPPIGSVKKRKRVARGNSAGGGTTAGRGTKGQQARAGKGRRFGFEGGQVPLVRRQPKLSGFVNPLRHSYEVINVGLLERSLVPGAYDVASLRARHLITTSKSVKLLGQGNLTKKFDLTVHAASKAARKAVEKVGGSVKVVRP
jgi:large subunit ribosomal protein L15